MASDGLEPLLAAVAGAGTGLGVAAAINPSFVAGVPIAGGVQSFFAGVEPIVAVVVGVLAIAAAVGATSYRSGTENTRTAEPARRYDRTVRTVDTRRLGQASDQRAPIEVLVQDAIAGDDGALARVRFRLRELAKANVTETELSPGGALATREWTDDEIAGLFLQPPESTTWPLSARVRSWLDRTDERRRRISRTIAAIEELKGADAPEAGSATPASGAGETSRDAAEGGTVG